MARSPIDSLEAYFHDLLTEEQGGETVADEKPTQDSQPVPKLNGLAGKSENAEQATPAELPVAKQDQQTQTENELRLLEEHKRQKLQEMLRQQALPQVQTAEKQLASTTPVRVKTEVIAEVKQQQKVLQKETAKTVTKPIVDTTTGAQKARVLNLLEWADNGRPIWAQGDFDALFFQVAGLTLAVPLVALGQIVKLDSKPTPIAGQSEWFMGVKHTNLGDIRTVNTALFVMPERYNPEFVNTAQFIISIDGLPWGLAVDNVNQPVRLNPADVSWRSERGKRPWLAGTVKAKMCALLDIPQMAHLLNKSDKNLR